MSKKSLAAPSYTWVFARGLLRVTLNIRSAYQSPADLFSFHFFSQACTRMLARWVKALRFLARDLALQRNWTEIYWSSPGFSSSCTYRNTKLCALLLMDQKLCLLLYSVLCCRIYTITIHDIDDWSTKSLHILVPHEVAMTLKKFMFSEPSMIIIRTGSEDAVYTSGLYCTPLPRYRP